MDNRNTLWALGDSFATRFKNKKLITYQTHIAEALDLNYGVATSMGGFSLPYLFTHLWEFHTLMRKGDRIIITLTSPDRTWFFRNKKHICHSSISSRFPDDITPEQEQALRLYDEHLHSPNQTLAWLQSWFYQLDKLCAKIGTKAIVIDNGSMEPSTVSVDSSMHPNIIRGKGVLFEVSMAEIANQDTFNVLSDLWKDARLNHLCQPNHRILADKILNAWETGVLDVANGFVEKCFDIHKIGDREWFERMVGAGEFRRSELIDSIKELEKNKAENKHALNISPGW